MEVNNDDQLRREPASHAGPQEHMERSGKGLTMQDFIDRAKELGATGEMSPNLELLLQMRDVSQKFDHTHDTVTNNDALVMLANAKLGERANEQAAHDQMIAVIGCPADVCRLAQQLFLSSPDLRHAFECAAVLVKNGTPVWDEERLVKILAIHTMMRR